MTDYEKYGVRVGDVWDRNTYTYRIEWVNVKNTLIRRKYNQLLVTPHVWIGEDRLIERNGKKVEPAPPCPGNCEEIVFSAGKDGKLSPKCQYRPEVRVGTMTCRECEYSNFTPNSGHCGTVHCSYESSNQEDDPGEGWEFCSKSEAEEWRCENNRQHEWVKAEAVPSGCSKCQYRRRIKQATKLVRKGIHRWTKSGRPILEGHTNPVDFNKIHGYVYGGLTYRGKALVSLRPSLLWSVANTCAVHVAHIDEILRGQVVRVLPVAVIVEE